MIIQCNVAFKTKLKKTLKQEKFERESSIRLIGPKPVIYAYTTSEGNENELKICIIWQVHRRPSMSYIR